MTNNRLKFYLLLLIAPASAVFAGFFIFPIVNLVSVGASGELGISAYTAIITNGRYFGSLVATILLSVGVTLATLAISGVAGVFLERNDFLGRNVLVAVLTMPLAFPGVVVGFMVIMIGGRLGIVGSASLMLFGERTVFAYSMIGLFVGYLYFSIPRVILTIIAAAEKLDKNLEEAARSLGARNWQVIRDVIIPALMPAIISSGAICFATSMGAFGTAFTLATNINVLPMTIYTEFTLSANIPIAAALSIILGIITWIVLSVARTAAGTTVSAAG